MDKTMQTATRSMWTHAKAMTGKSMKTCMSRRLKPHSNFHNQDNSAKL